MSARVWLVAALMLCGCGDVTEVVMVVDSDLTIPDDVDTIEMKVGGNGSNTITQPLVVLPSSIGFLPGGSSAFSVSVALIRSRDQATVVARSASDVRFVEGRTMMLVLMLPAACACDGTNCPNPETNPDCDSLVTPKLEPFTIGSAR